MFFHNSLQPLPRLHGCKRPSKLSTQCECTELILAGYFFLQPIAAECWERGQIFKNSWKKTQYLKNPLYHPARGSQRTHLCKLSMTPGMPCIASFFLVAFLGESLFSFFFYRCRFFLKSFFFSWPIAWFHAYFIFLLVFFYQFPTLGFYVSCFTLHFINIEDYVKWSFEWWDNKY